MRRLIAGAIAVGVMGAAGGLGTGSAVADPVWPAEADPVYPAEDPASPINSPIGEFGLPKIAFAVGGARPPGIPWARYTMQAGAKYLPDVPREIIEYPAGAIFNWVPDMFRTPDTPKDDVTLGVATDIATANLDSAFRRSLAEGIGPATAVGLSGGTIALDQAMERLANDPTAPPADSLSFVTIGDPISRHGFGGSLMPNLFSPGDIVPYFDFPMPTPVDSQYHRYNIVAAYDGFADFPDRPDNILALLNAFVGGSVVHTSAAFSSPAMVPPENIKTEYNSRGGAVTTILVPSQHLPLTIPLREFGVDEATINELDAALQPIIDEGYSRNDNPATRPRSLDPNGMDPIAVLDAPAQNTIQDIINTLRGGGITLPG